MVDKSGKFRWLVQLGYAARGLVYVILGYLALTTAGRAAGGGEAVFDLLQEVPLGTVVLYLMAAGLLAYAAFKLVSAVGDLQRHGSEPMGLAARVGEAASAVAHTVLAWAAFQYAGGGGESASGGGQQEAVGSVLELPLGDLLIGLVGLGFVAAAAMQARNAWTARFMRHVSAAAPAAVEPIGRVGHAARAVVFLVIGWSLVRSAWFDRAAEVSGLGDALLSLQGNGALYTVVAAGLLLFGLFSLVVARYGVIPEVHRADLRPSWR